MGSLAGEFRNGRYTQEELDKIIDVNARPTYLMKPMRAFYQKSATEYEPSWRDRREVSTLSSNPSNHLFIFGWNPFQSSSLLTI